MWREANIKKSEHGAQPRRGNSFLDLVSFDLQNQENIMNYKRFLGAASAALSIVLVPVVFATGSAQAQALRVLYSFTGGMDGGNPHGDLTRNAKGNLYGTTIFGGNFGYGTVLKVDTAGTETVLYSFTGGMDGANPNGGVVRDALSGNLYGTTAGGGALGCGTVFKVDEKGNETVLYSFTGTGADGANPNGGVVRDAQGNLYGTTWKGGASSYGTVFKVDTTGTETVLYSFKFIGGDGGYPTAGVVRDAQGNLYGTTTLGGDLACNPSLGCGTVYKVDTTGKETVLHSFTGTGGDGLVPYSGAVRDVQGNLFGVTSGGGAYFYGAVYKVDTTGMETVLHSFSGGPGDGATPYSGVVLDAQGNLYGTTDQGGSAYFYGTVFKVDQKGHENVLYSFTGTGADGANPQGSLVRDAQGILYGTTYYGGAYGQGTVFNLTPIKLSAR
jgi:uncharacterized repeat protein (TIGR03803 family)